MLSDLDAFLFCLFSHMLMSAGIGLLTLIADASRSVIKPTQASLEHPWVSMCDGAGVGAQGPLDRPRRHGLLHSPGGGQEGL